MRTYRIEQSMVRQRYPRAAPGDKYGDPIEQYWADQRGSDEMKNCNHCDSTFVVGLLKNDPELKKDET